MEELLKRLCEVDPKNWRMIGDRIAASTYMPNLMRLQVAEDRSDLYGWNVAGWMLERLAMDGYPATKFRPYRDRPEDWWCWVDISYSPYTLCGKGASPIEAIVRAYVAWCEAKNSKEGE